MKWQYSNPVHIVSTQAFHEALAELISNRKCILVMCSQRFRLSTDFDKLKNSLTDFKCFTDIEQNPSFESCQRAVDFTKSARPDVIVAIGGGSVIDTAKAARMALYRRCYNIHDLFDSQKKLAKKPMFIAIPTTHGSGSELTMWATIWDKNKKVKCSLSETLNYPEIAIYDANLVVSLPIAVSISSTLDALCHAWEALWNKNANPISNNSATEAIRLIANALDKFVEPISPETRENLLTASMYAGLAFSNTKTAAAHSISYPLTAHFNIPHGIACSMPLYSLSKINFQRMQSELPYIFSQSQLSSFEELWERIQKTVRGRIPFTLHEYGVRKEDLEMLAGLGFSEGRMENNIADLTQKDVLNILNDIF
jgi:alcohol dehydrogenase class IV